MFHRHVYRVYLKSRLKVDSYKPDVGASILNLYATNSTLRQSLPKYYFL